MRYLIGIDLGTTNSCVAYVDRQSPHQIKTLRIPQKNASGSIEHQLTLPSFCYIDDPIIVGSHALQLGSRIPTKLVHSAKSWLCHSAAPRRDKILPLEGSLKISPVEAAQRYLLQLREAWNTQMAKEDWESEFDQQEIVLTVPASFDEVARTLTVEAAKLAGIKQLTLLEEPQAAFYSWLAQHESEWNQRLQPGDVVLVCDVGGGTTDFSLIDITNNTLNRVAVGNHLLLGGDNMDAAMAHLMECKLGKELDPLQFAQLKHEARKAKEVLLGSTQEEYAFVVQGTGAKVVGGAVSGTIGKQEALKCLLEGFFGRYSWDEAIQVTPSRGIRSMGLPYEDDPSITKHLAHFLHQSQRCPNWVLFNGGSLKPEIFRTRILETLRLWFPNQPLEQLESVNFDLAVARGAAYYGKVRHGLGVKIGGGCARAYYLEIGVEGKGLRALTLLSRGCEEGAHFEPSQTFDLMPNAPVAFTLYTSHTRLGDNPGDFVVIDPEQMQKLPPIHTILRFGKTQTTIPVHLEVHLTPVGTVDLGLKSLKTDHRWTLEFQVRSSIGQENSLGILDQARKDEFIDKNQLNIAQERVRQTFEGHFKQSLLMESLEKIFEKPRKDWSMGLLRGLWKEIHGLATKRKTTIELEARWWNLTGYCLRPGFGYPLDDQRMKDLWKIILGDANTQCSSEVLIQQLICYRRVAGGLNKGQQLQIANGIMATLFSKKKGKVDGYLTSEQVRTLGAFEWLDSPLKIRIGEYLVDKIAAGEAVSADFWALGRIGARHLAYGSIINAVPREICVKWIERLIDVKARLDDLIFTFEMLARKTDQRELQIPDAVINRILQSYQDHSDLNRLSKMLLENVTLSQREQELILGDSLPPGLVLKNEDK